MFESKILVFYHVAKEKSFSIAAMKLNMCQSSVTRQIQKYESELKVKLFFRDKRSVSLTEEGKILLEKAFFIINEYNEIKNLFISKQNDVSGEIRFLKF